MVSDSITASTSIPSAPRDFGKKKRANRSAKLKQCKLDARREQWLSQVKNKGCKDDPIGRCSPPPPCDDKRKNQLENIETRRGGVGEEEIERESNKHHFGSDSPSNSPTGSSVLGGTDSGTNFSTSSGSGSSSSGCSFGSLTDEEEEGREEEDDNCLDDWEALADALAANDDTKEENQNDCPNLEQDSSPDHESVVQPDSGANNLTRENLRCECPRMRPRRLDARNNRAWSMDDEFRPQNLPDLSKQRSFPGADKHHGQGVRLKWACLRAVNVPTCCPICYEDLDDTDTNFMPCPCGFRLCLFCHKNILCNDGRCPGCRKPYDHDTMEAEASLDGGSLTVRLARSSSMIERS